MNPDARERLAATLAVLRTKGIGQVRLQRVLDEVHRRGLTLLDCVADANRDVWSCVGSAPCPPGDEDFALAEDLIAAGVTPLIKGEDAPLPPHAPPILFARGALNLLSNRGVGFCGSRNATPRGTEVAEDIASQLGSNAITAVSGGARGVDTAAHIAALRAGGTTIIVLAEGIGGWKPRAALGGAIDLDRTLVVSEFHPAERWLVGRAMQRNKTICALSSALVLIEARVEGGTFAAGEAALRMGIPLFCAVYANESEASDGNRILLERGASRVMASRATGRANVAPILERLRERSLTPLEVPV